MNANIKHKFLDFGDLNKGSSRIYGRNLSKILVEKYGIKSSECLISDFSNLPSLIKDWNSDLILFGKGISIETCSKIAKINKATLFGRLHPDLTNLKTLMPNLIDFYVVGSNTEKIYLQQNTNKNIFLVPQIEFFDDKIYDENFIAINNNVKNLNKRSINFLWHGDAGHLKNFPINLANALNEISHEFPIELNIVTNQEVKFKNFKFRHNFIKYSEANISSALKTADIGLVTSLNYSKKINWFALTGPQKQSYKTDRLLRYKTVSNPARCFLFAQHSIPFLCDENPEHYIFNNIFFSPICSTQKSWENSIRYLAKKRTSQDAIINNNLIFTRYHDYSDYASFIKDKKVESKEK